LIRGVHDNFNEFIQQIRVSYTPIYINNTGLYFFIKFKNTRGLIEFIKEFGKYSVQTVVSPAACKKGYSVFYGVVSPTSLSEILNKVIHNHIGKKANNKLFIQDIMYLREGVMYSKIDYARVFDPKTISWKYDHEKYMEELNKLSKKIKNS